MGFLIDANVLCEAMRAEPNAKVLEWLEQHDAELYISTLTLAEIAKGIHLGPRQEAPATGDMV